MRNNKSAIYGNMRRQGASGREACFKVMKSGGPDKANPFMLNKCLGEMKAQLSVGKQEYKSTFKEAQNLRDRYNKHKSAVTNKYGEIKKRPTKNIDEFQDKESIADNVSNRAKAKEIKETKQTLGKYKQRRKG